MMSNSGVCLQVDEAWTSTQLHDTWLRLFHQRNTAAKTSAALWQQWKDADSTGDSAKADRLWKEYSGFQSNYRVLAAWTDLFHTAWVFATDGQTCQWITNPEAKTRTRTKVTRALVTTS